MDPKTAYEILTSKANLEDNVKQALLDIIKKFPHHAYFYANNVIEGRFPEAEEYIKTDPYWAYFYAREVIGDENFWKNQELLADFMKSQPKSEPKTNSELDDLKKQREELDKRIKQLECV